MSEQHFTRQQLYELVWSKPLTTLEKEYQISANDFRSACTKFHIPLPKSGYWTKVQFGLEVIQELLPHNPEVEQDIVIQKKEQKKKQKEIAIFPIAEKGSQKESISPDNGQPEIPVVPERLTNPDPMIELTKKILTQRQSQNWESYITADMDKVLNIRVSSTLLPRALRLMDTILKTLRSHGYKIRIEHRKTLLSIGETEMEISLREKQKRELIKGKYSWQTAEYHPSGLLVFQARISYSATEWADGKISLENQLSKLITGIKSKAQKQQEYMQELRAYWKIRDEEKRIEDEKKKRISDELKAFQELMKDVERYRQAKVMREYADELERTITQGHTSEEIVKRIEWIRNKADWYDPFINAPDKLLEGFNKSELLKD